MNATTSDAGARLREHRARRRGCRLGLPDATVLKDVSRRRCPASEAPIDFGAGSRGAKGPCRRVPQPAPS
jgi:hypothetical protein